MRCNTIAKLHSPHACRRLYNARNCITASPSGHNDKFIMMMSTTTTISRTHTKSGHAIRSATPKMHPQAPHPNNAKAWFTPAYIARKPKRCGHCDFDTTPGSLYDQPWSKERARPGLVRQKTDPQDPQTSVRLTMKRKVAQRETQRAYAHARSYSGSEQCYKVRRTGHTLYSVRVPRTTLPCSLRPLPSSDLPKLVLEMVD